MLIKIYKENTVKSTFEQLSYFQFIITTAGSFAGICVSSQDQTVDLSLSICKPPTVEHYEENRLCEPLKIHKCVLGKYYTNKSQAWAAIIPGYTEENNDDC